MRAAPRHGKTGAVPRHVSGWPATAENCCSAHRTRIPTRFLHYYICVCAHVCIKYTYIYIRARASCLLTCIIIVVRRRLRNKQLFVASDNGKRCKRTGVRAAAAAQTKAAPRAPAGRFLAIVRQIISRRTVCVSKRSVRLMIEDQKKKKKIVLFHVTIRVLRAGVPGPTCATRVLHDIRIRRKTRRSAATFSGRRDLLHEVVNT